MENQSVQNDYKLSGLVIISSIGGLFLPKIEQLLSSIFCRLQCLWESPSHSKV